MATITTPDVLMATISNSIPHPATPVRPHDHAARPTRNPQHDYAKTGHGYAKTGHGYVSA